ncbi:MAG: hypothetical protein ABW076_01780 [Candidatus Thiodiazotropha sp.]
MTGGQWVESELDQALSQAQRAALQGDGGYHAPRRLRTVVNLNVYQARWADAEALKRDPERVLVRSFHSVAAANRVKIVRNQEIAEEKRFCPGLYLVLHLFSLDRAFVGLPVAGCATDNQVGTLLAGFRFIQAGHFGCLDSVVTLQH